MANQQDFLCVTLDTVPGRNVQRALGMAWGSGNSTFAAYEDMKSVAENKGANAVVGVRRSGYSGGCVLYGTAVILE